MYDLTDFYKSQPAKLDTIKFVTPDGRIVGVSVANEVQVIWYNKKMFDAAGLPYRPAEASQARSWNKFVQVAKQLTKDVNGKTPSDPGFDPQNVRTSGTWVQDWWMPRITFEISNGGGLVTPDGSKLIMNDPATIDAIQKSADLVTVDHVSPAPGTQQMPTAAATALLSQQVAIVVDGTWDLRTLGITKQQQGLDFGVGVLPYMKNLAAPQGVRRQLHEAVEIDGGSWLHKFRAVTWPMISPVTFFNLVVGLINSFQVSTQAYVMTGGGPNNASLFYVYLMHREGFQRNNMGAAAALSWVLFVIVSLLGLLLFRWSRRWVYYEGAAV